MHWYQWAPQWVAAFGTVGAFIAAVFVFRNDRADRRLRDRQAQARLVDAWVVDAAWTDGTPEDHTNPDEPIGMLVRLALSNGSAQAARTFDVDLIYGNNTEWYVGCGTVGPTAPGHPELREVPIQPAGATRVGTRVPNKSLRGSFKVSIAFTDSAGVRWHRDELGHLTNGKRSSVPRPPKLSPGYQGSTGSASRQ